MPSVAEEKENTESQIAWTGGKQKQENGFSTGLREKKKLEPVLDRILQDENGEQIKEKGIFLGCWHSRLLVAPCCAFSTHSPPTTPTLLFCAVSLHHHRIYATYMLLL